MRSEQGRQRPASQRGLSITFGVLDARVRLVSRLPSLDPTLRQMTRTYLPIASAPGPDLVYDFRGADVEVAGVPARQPGVFELRCNGERVLRSRWSVDLLAAFELDLFRRAIAGCRGWAVHAAALARADEAVVLIGPSGAGKTTLTLVLMAAGFSYLSDECAVLGPDVAGPLGVRGLTRPIPVTGNEPMRVATRGVERGSYAVRKRGVLEIHDFLCPDPRSVRHTELPVRALVRLRYDRARPAGLSALSSTAALQAFWPHCLNPSVDVLTTATACMGVSSCFELVTHDVDGARRAVESLLR